MCIRDRPKNVFFGHLVTSIVGILILKFLPIDQFLQIAIGTLSFLSFETPYGLFLAGSFGSSMVLLFGYPESPFAQPKNVFFGHLVTSVVGVLILIFLPVDLFLQIAIAVGLGIFVMILLGVTHPPAGLSLIHI